jgi:hypothetical protein
MSSPIKIGATRWSGLTKSQLILAKFKEKRTIKEGNCENQVKFFFLSKELI